jgi:hypothetical protein
MYTYLGRYLPSRALLDRIRSDGLADRILDSDWPDGQLLLSVDCNPGNLWLICRLKYIDIHGTSSESRHTTIVVHELIGAL